MIPEYKTNLTEQQYRSNYGRVVNFANRLRKKFQSKEITKEEFINDVILYAKKLKLLIIKDEYGEDIIATTEKIFGEKEETEPEKIILKSDWKKDPDVIFPKHFVTVNDRNAPCKIVENPNVKQLMLNTVDYADKVRREVHYTLCETPKGTRVSSPSFGSLDSVSRRSERTTNKCSYEFGKKSKEVGEFHTHPGIGHDAFSFGDLLTYKKNDTDAENYDKSVCVVSKVKRKGKDSIYARCTTGIESGRFLDAINYKNVDKKFGDESVQKLESRFVRDPNVQNAFSCIVDIKKDKPTKRLIPTKKKILRNYDAEYGGKVISYKKEIPQKQISKEANQVILKKVRPKIKSDETFLGLGAYL